MKKAIVILFAIAILGGAGLYHHRHEGRVGGLVSPANAKTGTQANASSNNASSGSQTSPNSFKDGTYTGADENTVYGEVQIAVVVSGGKITDINFLKLPNDRQESAQISSQAEPLLKRSTLAVQSANIDFVSGATVTSNGYQQSLQSALDQASRA